MEHLVLVLANSHPDRFLTGYSHAELARGPHGGKEHLEAPGLIAAIENPRNRLEQQVQTSRNALRLRPGVRVAVICFTMQTRMTSAETLVTSSMPSCMASLRLHSRSTSDNPMAGRVRSSLVRCARAHSHLREGSALAVSDVIHSSTIHY